MNELENGMVYISGPMSGLDNLNKVEFDEAEKKLKEKGYGVFNPINYGNPDVESREELMRKDFKMILESQKVFVLPGWEDSWGAVMEVTFAREIGIPVLDMSENEVTYAPPLMEAQKIINADRQWDYGSPTDDYTRTATMWTELMGVKVDAYQAVMAMIMVKLSRQINKYKHDNIVDICGYAACLEKIKREEMSETKS